MASAAPTPQDLYARLRTVYEGLSEEKIARKLDVGLKTFQRLNQGHGVEYETTVRLLLAAGWLDQDPERAFTRAELDQIRREARELARTAEAVADRRR